MFAAYINAPETTLWILLQQEELVKYYGKELADVLVLLIDIWLDPTIVNSDYEEMCNKVDFIILLLDKFDTPLISKEKGLEIKEGLKRYYV